MEEEQQLGRIVRESGSSEPFNPFASLVTALYKVRLVATPPLPRPADGKVRIALVSMPQLPMAKYERECLYGPPPAGVDQVSYRRRLATFTAEAAARMLAAFREAITTAVEGLGAHVVCVSELGFPAAEMRPMAEAQAFAHEVSNRKEVLIIAGSAHDERTLFNTGYIFHPGGPESGWAFHKAISATSMEEYIASPSLRRIPMVHTFGLRIATMICLDVADYATFGSLVKAGDQVDVVLVPCYTARFEKMAEIARLASQALPGMVALVNAHLPRTPAGRRHVARFGQFEPLDDRPQLENGAYISMITIDHTEFDRDRIKIKTAADPSIDWLFGNRQIPRIYA